MADMVGHNAAGEPELIKSTDGAAHVLDRSLAPGQNELLGAQETIPSDLGFEFVGVTSGADINLGAAGAAGDYCGDLTIRTGASVANITQIQFKDGTTVMEALTYTTAITPSSASVTIPGPRTKSKYGGWKVNITAAGATMNQIFGFARGKFS